MLRHPNARPWRTAVALWSSLVIGAAAWGADPGLTDRDILVGQSITLQSGKNPHGVATHQGAKLYIDAVNASGGVHGRSIRLRTLDDDNQTAQATANAKQLVSESAFVLFGSIEGGPSTAVMQVAHDAGVPFIGPMAGSPTLRRPHQPMVFPVRAEHREEFRALMTWGKRIGLRTVGFFQADSATGREHLDNIKPIAKELGLELVLPLPFKSDTSDAQLDAMVKQIEATRPDMVFNHGSADLYARLITKARQAGLKTSFMAVNSGSSQMAKRLGPLSAGMVFTQVVPSPWERKHEISREYQDALHRYLPDVEPSYGGLEGYITAKLLVSALRSAGRELSRATLLRALERSTIDLGGLKVHYAPGDHPGSNFVDLTMVGRNERFIH
jgi:ABC-type branched-subunit amino acid transport system substrate-binding protein